MAPYLEPLRRCHLCSAAAKLRIDAASVPAVPRRSPTYTRLTHASGPAHAPTPGRDISRLRASRNRCPHEGIRPPLSDAVKSRSGLPPAVYPSCQTGLSRSLHVVELFGIWRRQCLRHIASLASEPMLTCERRRRHTLADTNRKSRTVALIDLESAPLASSRESRLRCLRPRVWAFVSSLRSDIEAPTSGKSSRQLT